MTLLPGIEEFDRIAPPIDDPDGDQADAITGGMAEHREAERSRHAQAADPVAFARETLGVFWWSKQREIARSLVGNRYTAVKASHDTGKTKGVADLAHWWIRTHKIGEALVVTTAPTWKQVKTIMWKEIRKTANATKAPGSINLNCEWYVDGEIVALGVKPADNEPEAFSGQHALHVLVIIDEACGVPDTIFDATDTLMTNENARCVAIGNPDDPSMPFEKACRPGSGWNVIHIDGLRSPNFTAEQVARFPDLAAYMTAEGIPPSTENCPADVRPYLLSPTWVDERIKRWGTDSPMFRAKVRGEFPEISNDTLFPPAMLRRACELELPGIDPGRYAFDIARYGSAETTGYRNRDGVIRRVLALHSTATTETAGRIGEAVGTVPGTIPIVIDGVGLGAGVVDMLVDQGHDVIEFNGGAAPYDERLFYDRRSEVYWTLRQRMADGQVDLDEADEDLLAQLGALKYRYDHRGRVRVESKAEMAKRGLPSPDRADAVVMSIVDQTNYNRFERTARERDYGPQGLTGDLLTKGM